MDPIGFAFQMMIWLFRGLLWLFMAFLKTVPHGIKYGWIFVFLGGVGAVVICMYADEGLISWATAYFVSFLSVSVGIAGMVLKLRWNKKRKLENTEVPINPNIPDDLR